MEEGQDDGEHEEHQKHDVERVEGEFPDAVTTRGQKHLRELMRARSEGWRAVIFFLVQRGEAASFTPADAIDPDYGRLLREAAAVGVEVS